MFNTMTVTKTVAALCGALLLFLLLAWGGRALYVKAPPPESETAVASATSAPASSSSSSSTAAAGDDADAGAAAGDDFDAAYADADAAAGEKVFGKCKACHRVDGTNATGPHLDGVVDRPIASIDGFKYSNAMIAHEGANWDPATLSEFLTSPKTFAPGTKMSFAGLPKVADRANLIAYLATLK